MQGCWFGRPKALPCKETTRLLSCLVSSLASVPWEPFAEKMGKEILYQENFGSDREKPVQVLWEICPARRGACSPQRTTCWIVRDTKKLKPSQVLFTQHLFPQDKNKIQWFWKGFMGVNIFRCLNMTSTPQHARKISGALFLAYTASTSSNLRQLLQKPY